MIMRGIPLTMRCAVIAVLLSAAAVAEDSPIATVTVREPAGLARTLSYVEVTIAADRGLLGTDRHLVAVGPEGGETWIQVLERHTIAPDSTLATVSGIFPVKGLPAGEMRRFAIHSRPGAGTVPESGLTWRGEGMVRVVENDFYEAFLSQRAEDPPGTNTSGQLREMRIKLGFDHMLENEDDHLHWAPNFERPEVPWYTTISAWKNPREYRVDAGPYLFRTTRRDTAPDHPEIRLTAVYDFLAGVPWFRFFSEMEFERDIPLELLRNDEMTMDSMFTDLGFQRPDGEVVDVAFTERYDLLKAAPIENEAPWLCFYNRDHGYAFGSIRVDYDNTNIYGKPSPTREPHTQIGEWLQGVTYRNRRLIHKDMMTVPAGSRYRETNAYLVFGIEKEDHFRTIRWWAERLRNPLVVEVTPIRPQN